jgi:hypothetical protein
MRRQADEGGIAEALSAIPSLSRADLVDRWASAHGQSPPKGISRRLLEYSAAYQVQVQVKMLGGLKPVDRRKLRGRLAAANKSITTVKVNHKSNGLSSGARLVREWHGRTHTVEVIDGGFQYDGETYKSLSKIANVITGARWSGPRFFGV